jgi:flagellin-like protein
LYSVAVAKRKGISPVIATVIIVAVTIAVAIAVAFWMTGIIALFTGAVEKLEIVSASATAAALQQGGVGWQITVIARNTGTTQTTIDTIFINGIPALQWQNNAFVATGQLQCQVAAQIPQGGGNNPLRPGEQVRIDITLPQGNCGSFNAQPGVSIEVKLHTTGGKEYPKLLTLP